MLHEIKIKDQILKVAVADSELSRYKGLSGLEKLGNNKGLLFVYDGVEKPVMVMRDMNFPLDFLFIDKNWTIVDLGSLDNSPEASIASEKECSYVLELNKGNIEKYDIKVGDKIIVNDVLQNSQIRMLKNGGKFEYIGEKSYNIKIEDVKPEEGKLIVLDDEGTVVASIDSGSRIFSRKHTKALVDKYKKGDKVALADLALEILDIHDKQDPDFVTKD